METIETPLHASTRHALGNFGRQSPTVGCSVLLHKFSLLARSLRMTVKIMRRGGVRSPAMVMNRQPNDVTVEYTPTGDTRPKSWCVVKARVVLTVENSLSAAIATANNIARIDGSVAWVIVTDVEIPIAAFDPDVTRDALDQ